MEQEVHVQGRSKCQASGELLVSNTGQVAEKSFFLFFFSFICLGGVCGWKTTGVEQAVKLQEPFAIVFRNRYGKCSLLLGFPHCFLPRLSVQCIGNWL